MAPTPRPVPLDEQLSYRLHLLHKLTDARSQQAYLAEAGLPIGEGRCLAAIGAFEPLGVVHLAQRANLDKGQASRAAQSLVAQGLVARAADPDDARALRLTLTPRGRGAFKRVMALIERRNREIFGCLTATEQRQLGAMLARLVTHAQVE